MNPKVTVITPVYNGEIYIEGAIASLLAQSFQNWELVIVDDGSTDSTPQILNRYTDGRIRVIRQENSGEASARNVGLRHATGEYVAFLDADDLYFPNALEDLSSFLDSYQQYDVVYSDGQICDDQGQSLMLLNEIRSGVYTGNILEKLVLSSSIITVPVCTMVRRSKILEHSVEFDRNLIIGPDWDFWIQLAVHAGFGYLDKITCKYRIHNTNITKRVDLKKRRRDLTFGSLKVMNSAWFNDLSPSTREFFFVELLGKLALDDVDTQITILASDPFSKLPEQVRATLWRMVGIHILQAQHNAELARHYFSESLKINPHDRKTRFLIWSLGMGYSFTLMAIDLWQHSSDLMKMLVTIRYSRTKRLQSRRLQKLFGFR
jgi:glycosyltransferase involved in cell wall biosynthesis